MPETVNLYGKTQEEICALLESFGEKRYRGKQVFTWLYRGISSFDDMTDLSKPLREKLKEHCSVELPQVAKKEVSRDGTVKFAFRLSDGEVIESVLMSYKHGHTLCVSTQVGCNMGCRFCASTVGGKSRDLTAAEMIGQILAAQKEENVRIGSVVLMGMGEPLDNLDAVLKFMEIANEENGLSIGYRHFTLSTCGLCDKIELLAEKQLPITLSVSLHSPFDEERSAMMPVNKKYPIARLLGALRTYQEKTGRRISVEYALNKGKNDTKEHAKEIMRLFSGMLYHVNIIPINPAREGFLKSDAETVKRFAGFFAARSVPATVRRELGSDINAACGQLRQKVSKTNI